jgi:hypothetical protein
MDTSVSPRRALAAAALSTAARCWLSLMSPRCTRKCPSVSSRSVEVTRTGSPLESSTVLTTPARRSVKLPLTPPSCRSSSRPGRGRVANSPERTESPMQ